MDKMREEFEVWWRNANPRLTDLPKEQAYYIWKASRAALVVELPSHVNDMDSAPMLYESIVEQLNELGIRYDKY